MNDLKERYVETALDELHNGGPAPDLEARILRDAPAPVTTARWWLLPAACAAIAALVTCVILLPSVPSDVETAPPLTAPEREEQSAEVTPAGLGAKYKEVAESPKAEQSTPTITIDFVQKDLHTVLHYIGRRTGQRFMVESEADQKITISLADVTAEDALQTICELLDLEMVVDGDIVILKQKATDDNAATPSRDDDFKPDPDEPITIDFVQKDLHTVMHYIALRSGLQIIVEGEVDVKLTVMFRQVKPKDAIQSICKANKLDYIEDGNVIIIKARASADAPENILEGEADGLFNVSFEDHELVAAIMEVATVTRTQVHVPAVREDSSGEDVEGESVKVTLYMTQATPDQILQRLAELGELNVELVEVEGVSTYKFTWIE